MNLKLNAVIGFIVASMWMGVASAATGYACIVQDGQWSYKGAPSLNAREARKNAFAACSDQSENPDVCRIHRCVRVKIKNVDCFGNTPEEREIIRHTMAS